MNKLLNYLPPYLQNYRELIAITDAEVPEVDKIKLAINMIMDNQFIATLDEYGCSRWETMLQIGTDINDDLEIRRMRILSKMLSDIPYTEWSLREVLNGLLGEENYALTLTYNDYYLMVYVECERLDKQKVVINAIKHMIPANLTLEVLIHFREHEWLTNNNLTHSALRAYTHKNIRTIVLKG